MKSRRSSGFSLVEALFAFFIVTLVLGGMVHTLNQAAKIKGNTRNLDQAIEDFHTLLYIQSDVNAAYSLVEPTAGSTGHRIVLRKVDPRMTYADRTDTLSSDPLDPYEPSELVEIEYRVEDDYLVRVVRRDDGTELLAKLLAVRDFEVTLNATPPSILNLKLTVERSRVIKTRSMGIAVRSL